MTKIYDRSIFKKFFEYDNVSVISWATNVLNKLLGTSITPSFVNKEEDYPLIMGSTTQLLSYVVEYANRFLDIASNITLFEEFLQNRGIIITGSETPEQRNYLFQSYIQEYNKRGTIQITQSYSIGTESIDGELLRLLNHSKLTEFIFGVLSPQNMGWCLGHSSPTWNRTQTIMSVSKGYEYSLGISDINKYPRIGTSTLVDDSTLGVKVLKLTGTNVGIDIASPTQEDIENYGQIIDPNMSYELTCMVHTDWNEVSGPTVVGKFGLKLYDKDFNLIECRSIVDGTSVSTFPGSGLKLRNYWQFQRAILRNRYNESQELGELSSFKDVVILPYTAKYFLLTYIADGTLYITDLKLKPLYLPTSQGYLGKRNSVAIYVKNDNTVKSETEIKNFTQRYLLPYTMNGLWYFIKDKTPPPFIVFDQTFDQTFTGNS